MESESCKQGAVPRISFVLICVAQSVTRLHPPISKRTVGGTNTKPVHHPPLLFSITVGYPIHLDTYSSATLANLNQPTWAPTHQNPSPTRQTRTPPPPSSTTRKPSTPSTSTDPPLTPLAAMERSTTMQLTVLLVSKPKLSVVPPSPPPLNAKPESHYPPFLNGRTLLYPAQHPVWHR